ncbi:MAG: hypothetical protein HYZ53_00225 [Planctomycetes bacterium]|nr:hypothetical protein [Planctomycetota bacterium]
MCRAFGPAWSLAIALALHFSFSPLARGDTIVLKDGRTMSGEILQENADGVILKLRGIKVTLRRDEVQSVQRGDAASSSGPEAVDPVLERFAPTGKPSVDACRAKSLSLLRAREKAVEAVQASPASSAKAQLEAAHVRAKSAEKPLAGIGARRSAAAAQFDRDRRA